MSDSLSAPRAQGGIRKAWVHRIRIAGRETNVGLGSWPVTGLADARAKARLLATGQDSRRVTTGAPTFGEATENVIALLATSAQVSKGYLWSLENEPDKRPSAEPLYAIAEALGVTMSTLLGRRLLADPPTDIPESLREFANDKGLPEKDVRMLAGIEFRGVRPQTRQRWETPHRQRISKDPGERAFLTHV